MKQLQNILGGVLILLFLAQSSTVFAQADDSNITVSELKKVVDSKKDMVLLDVRTEQEFDQGYMYSAQNINFLASDFTESIGKLDKNKTYYVYCFSGGRSSQAVDKMKEAGFISVYNVVGGIRAWTAAGYDIKGGQVVK